jgi:hypothetical protein
MEQDSFAKKRAIPALVSIALPMIVGFVVVAWLAARFVMPYDWKIKYAILHGTGFDDIYIATRPTSCDWTRAPMGNKGCRYDVRVSVVRWARSTVGGSIVSYDDGETWRGATPSDERYGSQYLRAGELAKGR